MSKAIVIGVITVATVDITRFSFLLKESSAIIKAMAAGMSK
jgi:hypothetical protein